MKLKPNILKAFILLILPFSCYGVQIMTAKKDINFNHVISISDVYLKEYDKLPYRCELFDVKKLEDNEKTFLAKHYIFKNSTICEKDIYEYKEKKLLFDFGNIEIEKNAKIIFENDRMIKIKEPNGNVEKIYKNGRIE